MRRAVVLVIAVATGCDKLFDLEHVTARDGGALDVVAPADAAGDGGSCSPFDEDGDMLGDSCDPCPTFMQANAVDIDEDGVIDACDPKIGRKDRVALAVMFADPGDLGRYFSVSSGVTPVHAGNGTIELGPDAVLTTAMPYRPTAIDIRIRGLAGGVNGTANLVTTGATCRAIAAGCSGDLAETCVAAVPGGAKSTWAGAPANPARFQLVVDTTVQCRIGSGSSYVSANPTTAPVDGTIEITTSSAGSVTIESLVIYESS